MPVASKDQIIKNYQSLSEERKQIVRRFLASPDAVVVGVVLGFTGAEIAELRRMTAPPPVGLAGRRALQRT